MTRFHVINGFFIWKTILFCNNHHERASQKGMTAAGTTRDIRMEDHEGMVIDHGDQLITKFMKEDDKLEILID